MNMLIYLLTLVFKMKSIISFELDIDPSIFRLVPQYGEGKEPIPFIKLLECKKFTESGIKRPHRGIKVDHSIRKSKNCEIDDIYYANHPYEDITAYDKREYYYDYKKYNFIHLSSLIEEPIKRMVPKRFRQCVQIGISSKHNSYKMNNHKMTVIEYGEGDFFAKHRDSIKDEYHFATVIIMIPPFCKELEHEGGTLKVWDQNNKVHEFDSSKITKITVVAFNPTFEHECTHVTEGTRLIIKTDWSFDKYLFDLAKAQTCNRIHNIEELQVDNRAIYSKIEDIKKELNNKLDKLVNDVPKNNINYADTVNNKLKPILYKLVELDEEKAKLCSYNIYRIVKTLRSQKDKKYALIPLLNYYPTEDVNFMYKNELDLYRALRKVFGRIGIKNLIKKVQYKTEFCDPNDIDELWTPDEYDGIEYGKFMKYKNLDNYYSYNKYTTRASKLTFVMDTEEYLNKEGEEEEDTSEKFGKTIKETEYNDSTYDSIHNISYTCFVVHLNNYEQVLALTMIWQLREEECPHLSDLPMEILRLIVSFI
jgi:Rps23 Pro-64 3,4-dihydroxylase Tpa1-like proline 4-hydroxylase